MLNSLVQQNKNRIVKIAEQHGAKTIKLFGSVAKGKEKLSSDIDFLVSFEESRTLFDLIALKNDLEGLFNRNVDVVTEDSIHQTIRDTILKEALEI